MSVSDVTTETSSATALDTGPAQEEVTTAETPQEPAARPMMHVDQLTAHPGNVRTDLKLTPEYLAFTAENGVLLPLRITIHCDGDVETYRVIDGHRRLAAALKTGVTEVPYDMVSERSGDEAGQYLDMFTADRHHEPLTQLEQADALFAASEAGANKTRIRKATGLKAPQVKTALTAATLTTETRADVDELVAERGDQMSLEDLAILAEFQDDPDALGQLMNAAEYHDSLEHQAERLRLERADRAAHDKLRAGLEASGLAVTDGLPPGALRLTFLKQDGEPLTAESHAACPGRGAFFYSYDKTSPVHYCTDPSQYGHELPEEPASSPAGEPFAGLGSSGAGLPTPGPPAEDAEAAAERRRVIEGNRAWRAAATVRHRWLSGQLFAGRSAPRGVDVFIARQLLTMPDILHRFLTSAPGTNAFATVTGKKAPQLAEGCATATARKLPLLALAPIVAAYEHALSVASGSETSWRDLRFSPCSRSVAGAYFTFLASIGYELSAIEQAVADERDWQPGTPLIDILAGLAGLVGELDGADTADQDAAEDVPQDVPQDPGDGQNVPQEAGEGEDVPAGPVADEELAAA
jgi:ParB family chromosome partitioning protein